MRAAPFPPDEMPPGIRALHEDMAREIKQHLKGFVSKRADGALVGPFAPMLRFPQFGEAAWIYTKALIENSKLPRSAHEVAILVTGAAFNSRYELYAHEHVADAAGLTPSKIAAIAAGQRPADLTEEEAAAYDVAAVLAGGRNLPETTYRRAVAAFGEEQTAELIYLVGGYCLVSVLLNAFDMSVPGREEGLPQD
ncbi:carboxymuconolactone decarboxylase family protein [Roseomonas mucosa]